MPRSKKEERIRRHYDRRVEPDRPSYDILDWASAGDQFRRFEVFLDAVAGRRPPARRIPGKIPHHAAPGRKTAWEGAAVLDVGCGLTDFAGFLERAGFNTRYVGVDIAPGILREAHRRFPDRSLVRTDVFAAAPFRAQSFDFSVCSGIFNLRLGNNELFVARALPALLQLTRTCVAANFLHARTRRKYPHCFYYDPQAVLQTVLPVAAEVWLYDDYLENDFTLLLWK